MEALMRKHLRLGLLLALALFALAPMVEAGPGGCTTEGSLVAMGDEEIDVNTTAVGFTATIAFPTGAPPADMAVCTVEDDSIRFRANGLAPTGAVGTIVIATASAPGSFWACGTRNLRRFLMIQVTTAADVTCTYYRKGDQ